MVNDTGPGARIAALKGALGQSAEIDLPGRIAALNWALCQLGHGGDVGAILAALHMLVGELMPARNFAVALADRAGGLRHDYFVDERQGAPSEAASVRSLAAYVARSGERLVADADVFNRLVAQGEVDPLEVPLASWLGAPARCDRRVLGVLAVTSYDPRVVFTAADGEILAVVAEHLGALLARRHDAQELQESEERFRTVAQTAPCGILILEGGRVRYLNAAARTLIASAVDAPEDALWDAVDPDFRDRLRAHVRQAADGGAPLEVRLSAARGQHRWVEFSAGRARHAGRPATVLVAFDVTERKRSEERIRALAYSDSLTGLPNRLLLEDRLEMALGEARRRRRRVAILFVDLDQLKVINDSLGHRAGDVLLRSVAQRLAGAVRTTDTVARLGGDEFVVLVSDIGAPDEAAVVADKVLRAVRRPLTIADREVCPSASVGISIYPDDGPDAETLLKNADAAMYRAKEGGRDRYQLYTGALHAAAIQRLDMESALRGALERGELALHYQPVIDLRTRQVEGAEALLRWNHPERGTLLPGEFLAVVENSPLMVPVTEWILRTACRKTREWQRHGHPELSVAVKLCARHLQQPGLARQVGAVLDETGLAPRHLVLEITESQAMKDPAAAARTLAEIHELGVRVAIDHFGTGYSSLGDLKRLPIQQLKIDRSFVNDLTRGAGDAAIASAVVMLGHTLGLTVVAEGVESQDQMRILDALGCDLAQGYLWNRPLPEAACDAYLAGERPGLA